MRNIVLDFSRVMSALCLMLLFSAAALHAENETPAHDPALFAELVAAHRQHTTAQGTMQWLTRRGDDPTAPAQQQNVQFYVQFPDRYHLIITKPNDNDYKFRYLSDGQTRWEAQQLFADEKPDVKASPVTDGETIEQQLLTCLRFDGEKLTTDFVVTTYKNNATIVVVLQPKNKQLAEQITTLTLSFSPAFTLQRMVSDDPQGNRYEFIITELLLDKPLDEQLFRFGP
jgi:outer membrane lipoprotein-sorting protein